MKNEKTLLIGEIALENSRLKKQIGLIKDKVQSLFYADILSHNLKWDLTKDNTSIQDYDKLIEEEKENKKESK